MKFDLSKIQFTTNWASASALVVLLIAAVTLYVQNTTMSDKLDTVVVANKDLKDAFNALNDNVHMMDGTNKVLSDAVTQMMLTSPSELKYRIEVIEHRLGIDSNIQPRQPLSCIKPTGTPH